MLPRSPVRPKNLNVIIQNSVNSLNAILKVISIIIVPLGAMLFYKQHYIVRGYVKGFRSKYGCLQFWA